MPSTACQAGQAAPTPAAVELPSHTIADRGGDIEAEALRVRPDLAGVQVTFSAPSGCFSRVMRPAVARELAVYLVDCANALDNPAQRVIVDEGEPETARHMCSECNVLTDCPNGAGEGIGHE